LLSSLLGYSLWSTLSGPRRAGQYSARAAALLEGVLRAQ